MEYILTRAEISNSGPRVILWEDASIKGLTMQDLKDIVNHLFVAGILRDKEMIVHKDRYGRSGHWFDYYATINYDEFNKFNKKLNDRIKKLKEGERVNPGRLEFDEPNSLLIIKEYKIPIARRKEKTDEHAILKEIFKNKNDEYFYSELAEDILGIDQYEYADNQKYWQKFYGACERIKEKVSKATENNISDFLDFNSGIKGSVKINKKYIV